MDSGCQNEGPEHRFGHHFGDFGHLQKNVRTVEGAIFLVDFSIQENDIFCNNFYEFPDLGTIFGRGKYCQTFVRDVEPFRSRTQRYSEIGHAFFSLRVLGRC